MEQLKSSSWRESLREKRMTEPDANFAGLQCSLLQEHEFSQHTLIQMDTVTFQINPSHAINIAID